MDPAVKNMIDNLETKTGVAFDEWKKRALDSGFEKHGQIVKYLKTEHGLTHGYANLVSMKAREADSDSVKDKDSLVTDQYKGKEHFLPLYDKLKSLALSFGDNVELSPKKSYVSLRTKKQFGCLKPATKTRFEIGLNIRGGQESEGVLKAINKANAMFSHQIDITSEDEITEEVISWMKHAYAGSF